NIRNFKSNTGKIRSHNYNLDHIFKKGITWSALTAGSFSSRITPVGHLFDNAGSKMFTEDKYLYYIQGFLSTSIVNKLLPLINPTLNYQPGTLSSIPLIIDYEKASIVNNIVKK